MSVVRADRIAESRKLESCSLAGYLSYAFFVAALRDDFGRFRYSARCALPVLAPRDREDLTEAVVRSLLEEYRAVGLLRTWEQDGVTWAEWTGAIPRGNRFHRTPEPPWSAHVCTPRCEKTGKSMAKRWGDSRGLVPDPSGDGAASPDAASGDRSGDTRPSEALPFPPSSSSPSTATEPPRPPSAPAEGGDPATAPRTLEGLVAYAARLAGPRVADARWQRRQRKQIRALLRATGRPELVVETLDRELAPEERAPVDGGDGTGPPDPVAERLWEAVCARLVSVVSPHSFASWFRPTRGLRLQQELGGGEGLVVEVPSTLHLDWLSRTYTRAMLDAARAERPGLELRLLHRGPGAGAGVLLHAPEAAA
jgi:hypothetical protein